MIVMTKKDRTRENLTNIILFFLTGIGSILLVYSAFNRDLHIWLNLSWIKIATYILLEVLMARIIFRATWFWNTLPKYILLFASSALLVSLVFLFNNYLHYVEFLSLFDWSQETTYLSFLVNDLNYREGLGIFRYILYFLSSILLFFIPDSGCLDCIIDWGSEMIEPILDWLEEKNILRLFGLEIRGCHKLKFINSQYDEDDEDDDEIDEDVCEEIEICTDNNLDMVISLEEYKKEVNEFWQEIKICLLIDALSNEFYYVENHYRDDKILNCSLHPTHYSGAFKKIDNIREMIYRAEDNLEAVFDDNNELLGEFCYWSIDKWKLVDGEYKLIFSINQTFVDGVFDIYLYEEFLKNASVKEKNLYKKWERLSGIPSCKRAKIKFPYVKGDIVKLDEKPFSHSNEYCVFINDNGNSFCRDVFGKLSYKNCFMSRFMGGTERFLPYFMNVSDICSDEMFTRLATIVKNNSDAENEYLIKQLSQRSNEDFREWNGRIEALENEIIETGRIDSVLKNEETGE